MKRLSLLCFGALAVSILGCQSPKTIPELSKREYSHVRDEVVAVSVSELSKIITAVCAELDITIQETVEGLERYEYKCTSLSNRSIGIEAEALVKGRSYVRVTVQGDKQIAQSLCIEIISRLRSTAREYSRN